MLGFGQSLMGTAGDVPPVGSVYAARSHTGTGASRTMTTGIDLTSAGVSPLGTGGLVWIKGRSGATGHRLFDTARGATFALESSATTASATLATSLTAFGSSGFNLGADTTVNASAATYFSWTFRRARRFFDIVTYTGNSVSRSLSHDLGAVPGMILVKRTDSASNWSVWHNSTADNSTYLNLTNAAAGLSHWFGSNTSTTFGISGSEVNTTGADYVAYLFAHDATGDGIVRCGSYTGNGSTTGPTVTLGWEPQFIVIKGSSVAGNWTMLDSARGIATLGAADAVLLPNTTAAEASSDRLSTSSTGFQLTSTNAAVNTSGATYIYMAVRRP
jgi:hypothetical protein